MNWIAVSAFLLFCAVGLGAFGAHGLRGHLDQLGTAAIYEKAVFYHFIHALALLLVVLLARTNAISIGAQNGIAWLLATGIVVFSGSLYVLAISGIRVLGAVTPLGGVCFLGAWGLLAFSSLRSGT